MGIIQLAGDINAEAVLVFGKPSEGKTTAVMSQIVERGHNPLWLVFTNADIVIETHPEWDIAIMSNWHAFNTLYNDIAQGKIDVEKYDCVVIEGIHYASQFLLDKLLISNAGKDIKDPRPAYAEMGRTVMGMFSSLRGIFGSLYVTSDLVDTENGEELAVNPDLYNKIISLFGKKWYCYTEPIFEGDDVVELNYLVQTNPSFAIRFRPIPRNS